MSQGALHMLKRGLTHWSTARKPSIWGKWPSHGDYIRHNVSHEQAEFWLQWTAEHWHQRRVSPNLPIAFILPPRSTPITGKVFVQGVMAASQDKVGRACPIVIFQEVTPRDMARIWPLEAHALSDQHGKHLLFWWGRMVAHAKASGDFSKLIERVELTWQRDEPSFLEILGIAPQECGAVNWDQLVSELCDEAGDDAAKVKGVRRLPWIDWPARMLRQFNPRPAYWMQDSRGGYVCASDDILKLWGVST